MAQRYPFGDCYMPGPASGPTRVLAVYIALAYLWAPYHYMREGLRASCCSCLGVQGRKDLALGAVVPGVVQ